MKNISKNTRTNIMTYGTVIIAYLLIQLILPACGVKISSSLSGQLVPICAYIIMALSLNLTVGILGELSLGHAGFMSIGAFTGAVTCSALAGSVESPILRLVIALFVGAFFAGIFGFLIGIPVLRLQGDYLAIVTLAFGQIIKTIVTNLYVGVDSKGLHVSFLTSSSELGLEEGGKVIIDGPVGATGLEKISTFTIGVILIIITLIIILNLVHSRTGRAIMALRDNRIAAESVGIPITKYKLLAFTVSAALAGVAGVLFAMNYTTVVASKFDFNTSILILVFVVLGGLGNMWGSIIAATVLTILPQVLRAVDNYRMLIYAIILIVVMLLTNNDKAKAFVHKVGEDIKGLFRSKASKGGKA